jgi:hypothetical protein
MTPHSAGANPLHACGFRPLSDGLPGFRVRDRFGAGVFGFVFMADRLAEKTVGSSLGWVEALRTVEVGTAGYSTRSIRTMRTSRSA